MFKGSSCIGAAIVLGAALGLAPMAHADGVVITTGGLAEACYKAAKAEGADAESLYACDKALRFEELSAHDRAGTLVNQGVLLIRRKAYGQALTGLDEAGRLAPDIAEIEINRGAALLGLHRWAEARAALDKGLAGAPSEPEKAYFNRAEAEEALGDLKNAYLDYSKAVELAPNWDAPRAELKRFTVERPAAPKS
jgi:tetratricopeptide (TPR) repeat protein